MSKRYETHDCIGNVSDGGPHDISLKNPCTAENTNRQKGKGSAVIVSLCTRVQVFILVSVVNRDISVESFQTIEEAKKEMKTRFFATDGIEACLEAGDALLGETSAWCNADGGNTQCDWDIFTINKTLEKVK